MSLKAVFILGSFTFLCYSIIDLELYMFVFSFLKNMPPKEILKKPKMHVKSWY